MEDYKMSETKEYISESVEVDSSTPFDLDVGKALGGIADSGWITSDDGSVFIQLNGIETQKIPLVAGDTLNFEKEDKWRIKRIKITTASASALTIRYFLRKKVEVIS